MKIWLIEEIIDTPDTEFRSGERWFKTEGEARKYLRKRAAELKNRDPQGRLWWNSDNEPDSFRFIPSIEVNRPAGKRTERSAEIRPVCSSILDEDDDID